MDVEVWPVNERVLVATMGVWEPEIVNKNNELIKMIQSCRESLITLMAIQSSD